MISQFFGFAGSGFMIAFSWNLDIRLALVGLVMLTFQAVQAKMWNLVALNLISICGFLYQIFS